MIRAIEPADLPAWVEMRCRLWPLENPDEIAREAQAFAAGTAGAMLAAAFLAEDGARKPVGFIEMGLRAYSDGCDSSPVPHVEGWYVEPAVRGRGIGRQLMAAVETWARSRGFQELASDTELHNDGSLEAHQACGFQEVERLIKFCKVLE